MSLRRLVPPWADVALALLMITFIVAATTHIHGGEHAAQVDAGAYTCIAVAGGALAWRRLAPLTVVAIVTAALLGYLVGDYPGGPIFVTVWLALFTVATVRSRQVAYTATIASSVALFVAGLSDSAAPNPLVHLVFLAWAIVAVLAGDAVRSRRDRLVALKEHARTMEMTREEEARRRVAEERLRIARDLHDSVAHTMATINVHAGVAAHVIDRQPDEARNSLRVIERSTHEVLDELTAMLHLLRVDASSIDRNPTPDLHGLDALLESVRRTGVDVVADVTHVDVPQPVSVAAYRIVQESLTNVIRHAGRPVTARVSVTTDDSGALTVTVADDGEQSATAAAPRGSGVGITGMRERAESTGGTLHAGPGPERSGWLVVARWPAP